MPERDTAEHITLEGVKGFRAYPGRGWVRVKVPKEKMIEALVGPRDLNLLGEENCLFTFAKAYYKGEGEWLISGYAHDGSDVEKVLQKLGL